MIHSTPSLDVLCAARGIVQTPEIVSLVAEEFINRLNEARINATCLDAIEALRKIQVIAYAQVDGNKADMRAALLECIKVSRNV